MRQAVYCGPRTELLGKTAVIREPLTHPISIEPAGKVMAQFDFNGSGMNERNNGGPFNYLCFNWHPFDRKDFAPMPREPGERS